MSGGHDREVGGAIQVEVPGPLDAVRDPNGVARARLEEGRQDGVRALVVPGSMAVQKDRCSLTLSVTNRSIRDFIKRPLGKNLMFPESEAGS